MSTSNPTTMFKSRDDLTREQLADLFQTLADRVRAGQLALSDGTDEVKVALPEDLRVEVEIEDKHKSTRIKREIELEISWSVDAEGTPVAGTATGDGFTVV